MSYSTIQMLEIQGFRSYNENSAENRCYCSLVISREVFLRAKVTENPRHTARIYAISINSVHREACCWERSEQ